MTTACGNVLHHLSVERRSVPLRWDHPTEGDVDLSATSTVQLAYAPFGDVPALTDFKPAVWNPSPWLAQGETWWLAETLVGPGQAHELTPGRWQTWARVTLGVQASIIGPLGLLRVL